MSFKEINVSVIIQEKCNNSKEFKKSWDASQMEYVLPESKVTRAEGLAAFEELRKQAADVLEMNLEEINAEITDARKNRRR